MFILPRKGLISKRATGGHSSLDKIQESTNKEPKVIPCILFEVERYIEESDIPPFLPYRCDRGHHILSYIESILLRNMNH